MREEKLGRKYSNSDVEVKASVSGCCFDDCVADVKQAADVKQVADVKQDKGKVRLDLVTPEFIEEVGQVLTFGAEKYPANSWQKIPDAINRYYAAALRHLTAWRKGEKNDDESGLSHLSHAACNMMFLMWLDERGKA